jgi:hypothetical protein
MAYTLTMLLNIVERVASVKFLVKLFLPSYLAAEIDFMAT